MPQKNIFKIYDERDHFWQWDTGQKLIVLDNTVDEVHFSNASMSHALAKNVYIDDAGLRVCDIPDIIFQTAKTLLVYACDKDSEYSRTIGASKYSIVSRPVPEEYTYEEHDRMQDLINNFATLGDILENGAVVKRFDTLQAAEAWAAQSQEVGLLINVNVDGKWTPYVVDSDKSISKVAEDSDLNEEIKRIKELLGETSVEEQINAAIETLNLADIYVAKEEGKSLVANTEIVRLADMSDGANKAEASETNGNIKIDGEEVVVYTHPEKHAIAEVDGLQAALDEKQAASNYAAEEHTHTKDEITDFVHTHEMAEVNGLVDALVGKETAGEAAKVKTVLETYKDTNDAAVKANADAVAAIKDHETVDSFADVMDAVDTLRDDISTGVGTDELKTDHQDTLIGAINEVHDELDAFKGDVTSALDDKASLQTVQTLDENLDRALEYVDTLDLKMYEAERNISELQQNVDELDGRMMTADSSIHMLNEAMSRMATDAALSELAGDVADNTQAITEIKDHESVDSFGDVMAEIAKKANDDDLAPLAKTGSTDDLVMGEMVLVFDCGDYTDNYVEIINANAEGVSF